VTYLLPILIYIFKHNGDGTSKDEQIMFQTSKSFLFADRLF